MYLQIPNNGYHSPSPIFQPACLLCAVIDTYRKRAKRNISIEEYRKSL